MLCCTACEDGQTIASGSSNGSVHVWRVEYVTRSGGLPDKYTGFQGAQRQQHTVFCTSSLCALQPDLVHMSAMSGMPGVV